MASGVAVSDGIIKVLNDMKARKSSTPEEVKKCKKEEFFCLSENIILKEGKEILVGDLGHTVEGDPSITSGQMLQISTATMPTMMETKENKKEDVMFIFWASESEPLKGTVIYASSKDTIRSRQGSSMNYNQTNTRRSRTTEP